MSLNFLEELKKVPPKKRIKLLNEMREKNINFFLKRNPQLGQFIENAGTGGYNINISGDFLEVTHVETGQLCHPKTGLERYVKELGSPHHTGWIDKLRVEHSIAHGIEHGEKIEMFLRQLYPVLPEISGRVASGEISLPKTQDKKRFSGLTIFLGTFLGFHIAHYLLNTEVRDVVIVEPDLYKFALSCWFLDYTIIEKRFGRLVLHVGPDMPLTPEAFIDQTGVSSTVWLRLLPAYPSPFFDEVIHRFELKWRALYEVFVPFDREVRNLCYGAQNLQQHLPINYLSPSLSKNSRIAVVASGPSLDNDLDWLAQNQDNLIIFAAHSAVKTLLHHGIRPDFQCSLDTELDEALLDKLALDSDIPFISYYKANPNSLKRFKTVLLVNDANKANPVKFNQLLHYTHPTTGNLMLATACYAQPEVIYLLGLDLGTKDAHKDHVKGYWAESDKIASAPLSKEEMIARGLLPVVANFAEDGNVIYTQSYHNVARKEIESLLLSVQGKIQVFNLSDGARILYSQAMRTKDVLLTAYPEKAIDIACFKASFTDTVVYQRYDTAMESVLEGMSETLAQLFRLKNFDWQLFVELLDDAWVKILQHSVIRESGDARVEAYGKLITDLLTEWYRVIIFTRTPKETALVFKAGLECMLAVLRSLQVPAVLLEFEQ